MWRTARDGHCDGFLTIESGKTLTFIVEEFLNNFVCKQGLRLGRWKGKEVRVLWWNFTDHLYNIRWIFCGSVNAKFSQSICFISKASSASPQRSIVHNSDFIVRSTNTR